MLLNAPKPDLIFTPKPPKDRSLGKALMSGFNNLLGLGAVPVDEEDEEEMAKKKKKDEAKKTAKKGMFGFGRKKDAPVGPEGGADDGDIDLGLLEDRGGTAGSVDGGGGDRAGTAGSVDGDSVSRAGTANSKAEAMNHDRR